ncbi:PP2C family protein-serine/threonine phosphatase [Actinomadura viridis]|uniref:PP2C family protein-serine/threonine phosphatase n=1 Tax=Actinomadura viridis TaxID=58110 RepID=UPI0036B0EA16
MAEQDIALEYLLAAVEQAPPVESSAVIGRILAEQLGASDVCFMLTDFAGDSLWRLPAEPRFSVGKNNREELGGSLYDEVISSQRVHVTDSPGPTHGFDAGYRVVAPVTNRGDAIGVLELTMPNRPGARQLRHVAQGAHAMAYIVVANRRFTDLYEWGRRSRPLSLAAEIQHNLLPDAWSCEAGQAAIAGAVEPSGDIAGDTFDYSLDERNLHISITDAMGHDVPAAMLATLLVGALRNARRARADLAEQARAAHQAVSDFGQDATATGQLLRIDLATGRAQLVNAGHPWPLRLRDGRVSVIELDIDPPFGVPNPEGHQVQDFDLAPGDRVVLLTDGVIERNTTALDLPALIADDAGLHPREAVRSLTRALSKVTGGDLLDDATVVCLDWHGPGSSQRTA